MGPKKKDAREKQKREELERKAKEEEEQLRMEELKQRELEEKKRQAKEERRRQRAEEEQKFAEITERLNEELQYKQEELVKWKAKQLEKIQWKAFTGNGVPHPSDEKSMNTYLSLSEENQKNGDLSSVIREFNNLFKICDDIEPLLCGDGLPEPTPEDVRKYEQMLDTVRTAMMTSLNRCTMQCVMGDPKLYLDTEGHNILVENQALGGRLTYSLWGNVTKDPRYADVMFEKTLGFGFELPRRLLYEDVAIRIIQLDFDLLSPQCHTYKCSHSRSNISMTESIASVVTSIESDDEEEEEKEEEEEEEVKKELETLTIEETKRSSSRASSGRSIHTQRDALTSVSSDRAVEGDGKDASANSNTENEGEKGEEGEAESSKDRNEEGEEEGVASDMEGKKGPELKEDEVNLRTHIIAGKIFHFELLTMPPETKLAGTWKIRQVFEEDKVIPYPHPPASVLAPSTTNQTPNYAQDIVEFKDFKLPEKYFFSDNPVIARWDGKENIWRTEGLQDFEYNLEERTVTFKTLFFNPIAVMVDRYGNMPYQNWEMQAKGLNYTQLTIEGAVTAITVKIQGSVSTLIAPEDQPHLTHLINKPRTAHQLIDSLKKAGSFFFPEPDASKYSSVTKKISGVELEGYRSMALASSGYSFCWSRWNSEAPIGKVVMGVAEADQKSWALYVGGKKSLKLKVTEDSDGFSLDPQEGAVHNPGLYAALDHDASSTTKEALKLTSPMHMEAVLCWLNATKPLTLA